MSKKKKDEIYKIPVCTLKRVETEMGFYPECQYLQKSGNWKVCTNELSAKCSYKEFRIVN